MLLHAPIGDNADTSYRFSPSALADSPELERDLAEDRRAALEAAADTFDPLGLYTLELERDLAASILQETITDPAVTLSLNPVENRHRIAGVWSVRREWQAGINDLFAFADTPGAAVNAVLAAHKKATAPVRQLPEHRPLTAESFEAFGKIDPADGPALLALVTERHGARTAEGLTIEPDGRVMLATGHVAEAEAAAIGQALADFIFERTPGALAEAAIKIILEPMPGDTFKSYVVLPSGERIGVARCPTKSEACDMAEARIRAMRPTVTTLAVASTINSAA